MIIIMIVIMYINKISATRLCILIFILKRVKKFSKNYLQMKCNVL